MSTYVIFYGLMHTYLLLCSFCRDRPYLLFFDLTQCIYVVTTTVESILSSNETRLFACPTTQVQHGIQHVPSMQGRSLQ